MLLQPDLQEHQITFAQEALEQGVLRPLAISQQDFVDSFAPLVMGNIIGDDVAHRLVADLAVSGHRFST
jgi:hypothetical protein